MIQSTIFPPDRVTIVGVLNLTPDSFSDGGRFVRKAGADTRRERLRSRKAEVRRPSPAPSASAEP